MARRRKTYDVSPEDFVRAWQESDSPQQVADITGMPKPIVLSRATQYRNAGVRLKKMGRGKSKNALDVDGLNLIVEGRA